MREKAMKKFLMLTLVLGTGTTTFPIGWKDQN